MDPLCLNGMSVICGYCQNMCRLLIIFIIFILWKSLQCNKQSIKVYKTQHFLKEDFLTYHFCIEIYPIFEVSRLGDPRLNEWEWVRVRCIDSAKGEQAPSARMQWIRDVICVTKCCFLIVSQRLHSKVQINRSTALHNERFCLKTAEAILCLLCLCVHVCIKERDCKENAM